MNEHTFLTARAKQGYNNRTGRETLVTMLAKALPIIWLMVMTDNLSIPMPTREEPTLELKH